VVASLPLKEIAHGAYPTSVPSSIPSANPTMASKAIVVDTSVPLIGALIFLAIATGGIFFITAYVKVFWHVHLEAINFWLEHQVSHLSPYSGGIMARLSHSKSEAHFMKHHKHTHLEQHRGHGHYTGLIEYRSDFTKPLMLTLPMLGYKVEDGRLRTNKVDVDKEWREDAHNKEEADVVERNTKKKLRERRDLNDVLNNLDKAMEYTRVHLEKEKWEHRLHMREKKRLQQSLKKSATNV